MANVRAAITAEEYERIVAATEANETCHRQLEATILELRGGLADHATTRFNQLVGYGYKYYCARELVFGKEPVSFTEWIRSGANEKQRTLLDPATVTCVLSTIDDVPGVNISVDYYLAAVLNLLFLRSSHERSNRPDDYPSLRDPSIRLEIANQRIMVCAV